MNVFFQNKTTTVVLSPAFFLKSLFLQKKIKDSTPFQAKPSVGIFTISPENLKILCEYIENKESTDFSININNVNALAYIAHTFEWKELSEACSSFEMNLKMLNICASQISSGSLKELNINSITNIIIFSDSLIDVIKLPKTTVLKFIQEGVLKHWLTTTETIKQIIANLAGKAHTK